MPSIMTSQSFSGRMKQLAQDSVLIFPTETLYGIGCSVLCDAAVMRVFEIKGRDLRQPPPVLIADQMQLKTLVTGIPPSAQKLMDEFWPGSLTLILPARDSVSDKLCGIGTDGVTRTIGIRHTAHPLARRLCETMHSPLVATSANFSGATGRSAAPQSLDDIPDELKNLVDVVIDGGLVGGQPSTVVDCSGMAPCILRTGAVTLPPFNGEGL